MRNQIQTLFNKIGEEREKRFGKQAYAVLYSKFKKDFLIKNNPWTIIWTWPKECAADIIKYLEDAWHNTKQGRIERASKRENYLHTRPRLYALEKELLSQIGLEIDSPVVDEWLFKTFGVTSHKHIDHLQHWQFVKMIEVFVEQKIKET